MDWVCLQKFADSLWPGPPAIELRLVDEPSPGKAGEVTSIDKDKAVIALCPLESVEQSHWCTILHELGHVAEITKFPDSTDDLHGAAFRSEYRRILHKAVRLYRQEPLWGVLVEAVDDIGELQARFPAKPAPCRFWFHPIRRPWYVRCWRWVWGGLK